MVEVVRTVRFCNWALYHPWTVRILYGTEQIQAYDRFKSSNTSAQGIYLSLVLQRGNFLQHRARHLRARAELQVSTVCRPTAPRVRLMIRKIYNHLAHKSNQINLNFADSSRRIAMGVQKESSMMKPIALLTMTFLPATYVAVGHPNSLVSFY
jgi:hypothetical protein